MYTNVNTTVTIRQATAMPNARWCSGRRQAMIRAMTIGITRAALQGGPKKGRSSDCIQSPERMSGLTLVGTHSTPALLPAFDRGYRRATFPKRRWRTKAICLILDIAKTGRLLSVAPPNDQASAPATGHRLPDQVSTSIAIHHSFSARRAVGCTPY